MITISSIVGNKNDDQHLSQKFQRMAGNGLTETILMSRMESQRVRMRKNSDKGTDVAINLSRNIPIRHGDVLLSNDDKMIVVEILPEKVAVMAVNRDMSSDHLFETAVRVGHTIGNLHRPVKSEGNKIYFPIQADSELDLLRKLFDSLKDHVDITSTTMVFEPEEGTQVHEH